MIHLLTKKKLENEIDDFLAIDSATPGEPWGAGNFLHDMPDKWTLSFYATNEKQKAIGFVIASVRDECLHIHRLAVDRDTQGKGVGRQLVEEVKKKAVARKAKAVTLKVARQNMPAIQFYHKLGFVVRKDEGVNHWMELKI